MSTLPDRPNLDVLEAARSMRDLLRNGSAREPLSLRRFKVLWPFVREHSALAGTTLLLERKSRSSRSTRSGRIPAQLYGDLKTVDVLE